MGVKNLAVLSGLPLIAAGILGSAVSAQAAVLFSVGDELSISGSVDFSQGAIQIPGVGASAFRFEDTAGNPVATGGFGNFGVLPTSTGAFAAFRNNGNLDSDYKIRSLDIAPGSPDITPTSNAAVTPSLSGINFLTCTTTTSCGAFPNPTGVVLGTGNTVALNGGPFITLENGLSGNDPDVKIFLDEIAYINTTSIGAGQLQTVVSGFITAVADNTAFGVGSFNATFTIGDTDTSYSATFKLTQLPPPPPVPEPASVLGLLAVGALGATRLGKRKQS
jgi:hypothetical protein